MAVGKMAGPTGRAKAGGTSKEPGLRNSQTTFCRGGGDQRRIPGIGNSLQTRPTVERCACQTRPYTHQQRANRCLGLCVNLSVHRDATQGRLCFALALRASPGVRKLLARILNILRLRLF